MLEAIILGALAVWAALALRSAKKHKGSCGGDCSCCKGNCNKK